MSISIRLKYHASSMKTISDNVGIKKESGSGQFKRGLSGPAFRLDT